MLKVVEMFSGIGSQKQALVNTGIHHEIVSTIEWEIAAIIAYQIIHHGTSISSNILDMDKKELLSKLSVYDLSNDGKSLISSRSLNQMPISKLQILLQSISGQNRKHFTNITKVKGSDLPQDIDLLTYSFPCQDLSIGSVFHNGGNNGIQKNGGTRSGLLWEVERILDERFNDNRSLPQFLLMENVMQVFSRSHSSSFKEWMSKLESLGYYNHFSYDDIEKKWILNAKNYGLPQVRKRAFMLSIKTDGDSILNKKIDNYLSIENNLIREKIRKPKSIKNFIYLDKYFDEQISVHPNYTQSRKKIHGIQQETNKKYTSRGNPILVKYYPENNSSEFTNKDANTITTKQDRDPNAGLIETEWGYKNNKPFRYLTQRECFALMGFPKEAFSSIKSAKIKGLEGEKLYKLAGNSICVPILEEIFLAIQHIRKELLNDEKKHNSS